VAMDFTDVLMLGLILVSGEHPARAGMSPGRSEPGGRGPRLETKVAFRYVPGMAHTGRPRLGLRVMTPAERVRRHRAKRARDAAALRLNQIVCGHAAEVMAGWPSKSIDLIITSPPYWDAVIYDGDANSAEAAAGDPGSEEHPRRYLARDCHRDRPAVPRRVRLAKANLETDARRWPAPKPGQQHRQ